MPSSKSIQESALLAVRTEAIPLSGKAGGWVVTNDTFDKVRAALEGNSPVRFRIEVTNHGDYWEATVYDHEDHGADLMYAGVTGGSLAQVLDQAAHYALVAE